MTRASSQAREQPVNSAMSAGPPRKIIHVDMDAFYASVEQRDDPALRGKPVAVGGGHRGVVAAASYEAREFGVRSAMPSVTARRRCPDLIFVKPRFDVYKAVSMQIRAIFADYTDLIEPLSLDEAYLDVSEDRRGLGSARAIAEEIRARIKAETGLTASAGVSYCKFIAKLASDQNKPDGICVITPERGAAFVATLPVKRFHGVGPVTAAKMERLGIHHRRRPAAWSLPELEAHFGSSGGWYWRIARGIDDRAVKPDRPYKSVSAERTFDTRLVRSRRAGRRARTGRGLCLDPDRARRGQRANGDAQGQVRRFHPDYAVEELAGTIGPPGRLHRRRAGASGAADAGPQGNPPARPGPSYAAK